MVKKDSQRALPPNSLAVSTLNTIHQSRLTVFLPDSPDLDPSDPSRVKLL